MVSFWTQLKGYLYQKVGYIWILRFRKTKSDCSFKVNNTVKATAVDKIRSHSRTTVQVVAVESVVFGGGVVLECGG